MRIVCAQKKYNLSGVNLTWQTSNQQKRILVINKKTSRNRRIKSHLKAILKNFDAAIVANDMETAKEKLALAEKKFMQAASKGTIHKNTASRKVSRLTKRFNKANA